MRQPTDVIENATNDPRFDTFWKRLNFFREPDETDEEFAERIGVEMPLFNDWRHGNGPGDVPVTLFQSVAQRLDVFMGWLATGMGHDAHVLPDQKTRLTSILRYCPWHQFTDSPADNEPRPRFEC